MNFLLRLLLVLLAGMFILVARWAEQSYQNPGLRAPLTQASRYCTAPTTSQALAPVFVTASLICFPQQAAGSVPTKQRLLPESGPPQTRALPTY